jgi:hypothetical protein
VSDTLRDAAYVAVGFGVLGFQRAQARRRQLTKLLEHRVEPTLHGMAARIDPVLDDIQQRLPDQAGALLTTARRAAKESQEQLLARLGRPPAGASG